MIKLQYANIANTINTDPIISHTSRFPVNLLVSVTANTRAAPISPPVITLIASKKEFLR